MGRLARVPLTQWQEQLFTNGLFWGTGRSSLRPSRDRVPTVFKLFVTILVHGVNSNRRDSSQGWVDKRAELTFS